MTAILALPEQRGRRISSIGELTVPTRTVVVVDGDGDVTSLSNRLVASGAISLLPISCPDTLLPMRARADVDAVLLNPGRAGTSMEELIPRWRDCAPTAALIVFSNIARGDFVSAALRLGADDVHMLPCSAEAVLLRVDVACSRMRRDSQRAVIDATTDLPVDRGRAIAVGPGSTQFQLSLDLGTRVLACSNGRVLLTRRECAFLEVLARRARATVSRSEILRLVWGREYRKTSGTNPVDVYARTLRQRLRYIGLDEALTTVRYVGYRLDADATVIVAMSHSTHLAL